MVRGTAVLSGDNERLLVAEDSDATKNDEIRQVNGNNKSKNAWLNKPRDDTTIPYRTVHAVA